MQYEPQGQLSDLNALRSHALSMALLQYNQAAVDRPDDEQSFASVHAAVTASGGLHAASGTAFWGAASVRDQNPCDPGQAEHIDNGLKIANWYPPRGLAPAWVVCGALQDTIAHPLGTCTVPAMKNQSCARHGHAVHKVAMEIGNGSRQRHAHQC